MTRPGSLPRAVYNEQSAERTGVPTAGRHLRYSGNRMTPEYRAYKAAVSRCHDEGDDDYADYGARGIRMCDDWRWSGGFDDFVDHIGPRPGKGFTLGRIDNARGYEPGNVRWETWTEQANNRRSSHHITIDGVTKTAAEWARHLGAGRYRQLITNRIRTGWHPTVAVLAEIAEYKAEAHARLGLAPTHDTVLSPRIAKSLATRARRAASKRAVGGSP